MKLFIITFFLISVSFAQSKFHSNFLFGLATAPGHVEDQLDDIWKDWAERGRIRAFKDTPVPYERLQFWTHPEVELDLAQKTGIQIYRMGIDWGRVMPNPHQFDQNAINRYHEILAMIKSRGMKVMLTLMHHAVPKWAQSVGGWHQKEMEEHFLEFSKRMIQEFSSETDYWITFNEANIFATLSYSAGMWPPGEKRSFFSLIEIGPFRGKTLSAMDRMSDAHNKLYEWAHQSYPSIKIGIAQNMAHYSGKSFWNRWSAALTAKIMNWRFPEKIRRHMDFFGFNYYGAEWIRGTQVDVDPAEEYSEAGRAIYPEGLYLILKEIDQKFRGLPIIITENGISDATDVLRPSYLIEHLRAISAAHEEGIPVIGYIFWTLSDNMEWSDGYCPKFGLVEVERDNNLNRRPRESYFLFQKIVTDREITPSMRTLAWNKVKAHTGQERPFCRADDGITALDTPIKRKFTSKDWRFR